MEERVPYEAANKAIGATTKRVILGSKTYALANITSVTMSETLANRSTGCLVAGVAMWSEESSATAVRTRGDAVLASQGRRVPRREPDDESGDCPWEDSTHQATAGLMDFGKFNGCYDEEAPEISRSVALRVSR